METASRFTQEDLETRDAIGVILRDEHGNILIQDHVKLDFFTIPIGKLKAGDSMEEKVAEEMRDEHGIEVGEMKKIGMCEGDYDYDGRTIHIRTHIFEILSYNGIVMNKEPLKHRAIHFMSLDEIRGLPKISDATKFILT